MGQRRRLVVDNVVIGLVLVVLTTVVPLVVASSDDDTVRTAAMESFRQVFYQETNSTGYFLVANTGGVPTRTNFWTTCELIEMVEDVWERTRLPEYAKMIQALVAGLNQVVSGTDDWASWDIYNDDIMWGVLALVRAYKIVGNPAYLNQAVAQYDAVWQRGWDAAHGGGFFWNTLNQTKNACVNGPAAIAGYLLAEYLPASTDRQKYRDQADATFQWLYATLYNAATGEVADHIDNQGQITWWPFTYNQGTFIGAAALASLQTAPPISAPLRAAAQAANWTRSNLTGQHLPLILNDEYSTGPDPDLGDGVGFKGIFARWCGFYAQGAPNADILQWLDYNYQTAWSFRNQQNATWAKWWTPTPNDYFTSWECSDLVVIAQTSITPAP
jgi:predicted alpha-1,6-mannanase (GH76 family)